MNTKRITKSGGISIPVGLRRELSLQPGDSLDVEADGRGRVILSPHLPRCVFCGATDGVITYNGKGICQACADLVGRRNQYGGNDQGAAERTEGE